MPTKAQKARRREWMLRALLAIDQQASEPAGGETGEGAGTGEGQGLLLTLTAS